MWIELIGLPGVGKTTLIENHLPLIRDHFTIVESRNPGLINRLASRVYYHLKFAQSMGDQDLAKKLAYRSSFRCLKNPAQNLFFYDSGVYQTVMENLIETDFTGKEQKLSVLKTLKAPDILIYITEDLPVILERETARPQPRFNLPPSELKTRYAQAQKIIEQDILPLAPTVHTVSSSDHTAFAGVIKNNA